jgi:DNA (cytosine-5)-methyltransferase 1
MHLAMPNARVVCYVENEAFACETLASKMETGFMDQAPIWTNLRTFDGKSWRGIVDCIIGGYPCQPFSLAGRQKGEHDTRHLWPCILGLIKEINPSFVFFENVSNHLQIGYETVRRELQETGYLVEQGIFSASEVGATHLRKRLFILGCRPEYVEKMCHLLCGRYWKQGERILAGGNCIAQAGEGVADALSRGYRTNGVQGSVPGVPREEQDDSGKASKSSGILGHTYGQGSQVHGGKREDSQQEFKATERAGRCLEVFPPGPEELEKWKRVLEEFPEVEPAFCLLDDELAPGLVESILEDRSMQLRLLGNGVVPACAAFAFGVLLERIGYNGDSRQKQKKSIAT